MRFFNKRKQTFKPFKQVSMKQNISAIVVEETTVAKEPIVSDQTEADIENIKSEAVENNVDVKSSNKSKRKKKNMDTKEKIEQVQQILNNTNEDNGFQFKRIKKDKGLIERTESSKTIITEDNKELLVD